MPRFALAVHKITGTSKGKVLALDAPADSGATPRMIMQNIFNGAPTNHQKDDIGEKAIQFVDLLIDADSVTGLLRQGAFGTAADILNVDDGNVAHEKKTNEAEMRPFFFNVWLPESAPFALVCSLRISNDGIIGSLAQ